MDVGIFPHVKGVHAVVPAGLVAAVVNAAARHNVHIAVLPDKEIVIYHFLHAGLGDDDGDMAGLAHRAGLHPDVNARLVGLAGDLNVLRALPPVAAGVLADVEGSHGFSNQIRDLFKQLAVHFRIHHSAAPPFVRTGQEPSVSAKISGRISSTEPRWRMLPSPITTTSSAREMMRS